LAREIEGFEIIREGNILLAARGALREALARKSLSDLLAGAGESVEGRQPHTVVELPGGIKAVVRHYTHGGLLRKVTGDRFVGSERFFDEVRVSGHLRKQGINTPEVLGLIIQAAPQGLFQEWLRHRRGALVTRMVEGGRDMLEYARSKEGAEQLADLRVRRALIRSVAQEVRRMHDAGVCHADLHIKNLLLGPGGEVFILDLDRAKLHGELGLNRRMANLIRLGRSLEKTGVDRIISGRDSYVFFLEYLRAGRLLKLDAREVVKKYRRHVARHRLFWKLGIR